MEKTLQKNDRKKQTFGKIANALFVLVRGIVLAGICYYILYPLIVKLSLSIMANQDLYDSTVALIPRNFSLDALKQVWDMLKYPEAIVNSLVITIISTITQVISCTLVGYGFAKFDFPLKKLWFALVMFVLIVPPTTIIIPTYLNYRFFDFTGGILYALTGAHVNLVGQEITFAISGITCMGFRNGLYIYLIRQCYRGVPKELEEAAMIDGAGFFKTFYRVMLPSAKSILTTIIMFSVVWQWTDVFYTNWFMMGNTDVPILATQLGTLSNQMQAISASLAKDVNYMLQLNATGSLLGILPLLIMYIFGQKMFVEGVERSGIVG